MIPLSTADITVLLQQPEGEYLDFKRDQYALHASGSAGLHAREELIKDILAFANTKRSADATILLGVEEVPSSKPNAVGIVAHLNDADIQQLVNSKVNRPVRFQYERVDFMGIALGAIRIDREQSRPIFLRSNFEKLRANIVYARQGSSTRELSPDEILQMSRLPVATRSVQAPHPAIRQLVERWLSIFEFHGIQRPQIGLVLQRPDLVPAHFQSTECVLSILSDDLIDDTCRLFNIDRGWLDESGCAPLNPISIDSQLKHALNAMVEMRRQYSFTQIVGIKTRSRKPCQCPGQSIGMLIQSQIMELNNRGIFCYLPFSTGQGFSWSEVKYRWYAKRLFLAAHWLDMFIAGWTLSISDMTRLGDGEVFPEMVNRRARGTWHPDDYIVPPEESVVAKEVDDFHALMNDCRKSGFIDRLRAARALIPNLKGQDPERHLVPN